MKQLFCATSWISAAVFRSPIVQASSILNSNHPFRRSLGTTFKLLLLLFTNVFLSEGNAQLGANYAFNASAGTYSSISATGTAVGAAILADDGSVNITGLTPGFTVNGVTYTNARMNSNGWLALYATTAPTTSTAYTAMSTAMTNGAVIICPFNADQNGAGAFAWRQTIGNEHIFEWQNFYRFGTTGEGLNYQVRLNTSTGAISFVYGNIAGTGTGTPQIGFKTTGTTAANWATDVNNLTINVTGSPNTCTWANAVTGNANNSTMYLNNLNPAVKPASGQTFTWTPQASPAPVRTFAAPSGITSSAATIAWTAPTGATSYEVQYRAVGQCAWTNFSGNPVATATATLSGLTNGTAHQVRVRASNGSVFSIWSHIPSSLSGAGTNGYIAAGTFTTLALPPTVTGFTPNQPLSSGGGQTVVITGTSFIAGALVRFNGVLATGIVINSTTQITCLTPVGISSGNITVQTSAGTSATGAANAYTVTSNPTVILNTSFSGCSGSPGGIIESNVIGGTAPYSFIWSNSSTTPDITGLLPGVYSLTVQDSNGATATAEGTISNPDSLSVQLSTTDAGCNGASNGAISSAVNGGAMPFTFLWSNGATTQQLNGVQPGNYNLTVTDNFGCTVSTDATVVASGVLANITATFLGITGNNATVQVQSNPAGTSFQWQIFNGSTWVNLTNTGIYSGTNTSILQINTSGGVSNNQLFRCNVTSNACSGISNSVSLILSPTIASFSPAFLCPSGGQTVTITGQNFVNVNGVLFGNVPANNYTVVNATTITATYPALPGNNTIVVNTVSGSASIPFTNAGIEINSNTVNGAAGILNYVASANTANNAFQWQSNIGFGFQNLSDAGQYSVTTTSIITLSNVTSQNNNQLLRCINTTDGCVLTSAPITIESTIPTASTGVNTPLPGISYQAIARNISGSPLVNENIQVQLTLREGSASGNSIYSEAHSVTTNSLGLFTLVFGGGNALQGSFNNITWLGPDKYLHVSIDFGSGFIDMGTQQLLSVPFAKLAEQAKTIDAISLPIFETNSQALSGGLSVGDLYRNSSGNIRVVQ
jgi:hypothetical protein